MVPDYDLEINLLDFAAFVKTKLNVLLVTEADNPNNAIPADLPNSETFAMAFVGSLGTTIGGCFEAVPDTWGTIDLAHTCSSHHTEAAVSIRGNATRACCSLGVDFRSSRGVAEVAFDRRDSVGGLSARDSNCSFAIGQDDHTGSVAVDHHSQQGCSSAVTAVDLLRLGFGCVFALRIPT